MLSGFVKGFNRFTFHKMLLDPIVSLNTAVPVRIKYNKIISLFKLQNQTCAHYIRVCLCSICSLKVISVYVALSEESQ